MALVLAFGLSCVMPATNVFAAAEPIDPARLSRQLLPLFAQIVGEGGGPVLRTITGTPPIDFGNDGRLTFLLLGLDSRTSTVSRTDTVMVVSLKGSTISAASIPRDTKLMPNPFGGPAYGKVNSILRDFYTSNGYNLNTALNKFEVVIEHTLQTEIDYHALVWFGGFTTLVDQVDTGTNTIRVDIASAIYDATHHDLIGSTSNYGVYFPQANDYQLFAWNPASQTGSPYCNGAFKKYSNPAARPATWCKRALPFVRTRHGSSDYIRGRRQQRFIDATIDAVDFAELSGLVNTAVATGKGKWWTNFPITIENATQLYNALQGASLVNGVVFKPTGFATKIYRQNGIELKLPAVRQWCDTHMG